MKARNKRKWRYWLKENWPITVMLPIALLFVHAFLLTEAFRGPSIDATNAGQFGDFVGGYLGTIFLIVSVAAFLISYRDQRTASERISFESRFFELIKYHRENVAEIKVGEKTGRLAFPYLIHEFREAHTIVSECAENLGIHLDQHQKINLTYLALYYGVGERSSRLLKAAAEKDFDKLLIKKVSDELIKAVQQFHNGTWTLNGNLIDYRFFNGHQTRLAIYYRHFYQTVKYAAEHAPRGKSEEYVDIARIQLTNHEQALLCLNCLSNLGKAWIDKGYLSKFGLIKNLPKDFFDPITELDIEASFPDITFEYDNVIPRQAPPLD